MDLSFFLNGGSYDGSKCVIFRSAEYEGSNKTNKKSGNNAVLVVKERSRATGCCFYLLFFRRHLPHTAHLNN